jgi:phosphonoacetaldehyde hydrolase
MSFEYKRHYAGPIQAIIFDWAGTIIDHGSVAPIVAFTRLFENNGVTVSEQEARIPMGAEKWAHIRAMCDMPSIQQRWIAEHGSAASDADVDKLYEQFVPLQLDAIKERTKLIHGFLPLVEMMRERGVKLGTNTGYAREMAELLLAAAAEHGFVPDSTVCATEVSRGRPYPFMALKNMIEMEIETVAACVKVDDTAVGIEEGLNAGMWTVAVALSGNEIGMTRQAWEELHDAEQDARAAVAYQSLQRSGAHYVIDSVADLAEVIEDIEIRMSMGERP